MSRFLLIVIAAAALAASAAAQVATWQIDPAHTSAQFSVKHLGVSTVRGAFTKVSGSAKFDSADPAKTSLEATIDAASVDTRVEMRDNDLRSPNFFDVAKYPALTFKSKKVEAGAAGKLKVTGDLTINATTRQVVLAVDGPSQAVKDAQGRQKIGLSAEVKINRKDFGITWNEVLETGGFAVADEVSITLDIELIWNDK